MTSKPSYWKQLLGRKKLIICILGIFLLFLILISFSNKDDKSSHLSNSSVNTSENNYRRYFYSVSNPNAAFETSNNTGPDGTDWSIAGFSKTDLRYYGTSAVSVDGAPCATIAKNILKKGGTVADAAIAALFCNGVVNSQSMGLGGGFFLTYYNRANKTAYVLDSREKAPSAATLNMFSGNSSRSTYGGESVAVPGELRGYHELYKRFGGGVSWRELIQPTIQLCEQGHAVNWHMARSLNDHKERILQEKSMSIYVNPKTNKLYTTGEIMKRPTLAATLKAIQDNPDEIYTGKLSEKLLQDLKRIGSIINKEDLMHYRPKWREPVVTSLKDYTLYTVPPPGSGLVLSFILNVMDSVDYQHNANSTIYEYLVEAFKFAYAHRMEMGDEDFVDMEQLKSYMTSEEVAAKVLGIIQSMNRTADDGVFYGVKTAPAVQDHGTAHLSILAPNGDAVSVTSSINLFFGSGIRSPQTGIIFNDQMDDFSSPHSVNYFGLPPTKANFISPGKRPMSSMSPSVIVHSSSGNVKLVIGAAGGSKIPTAIAGVVMKYLWQGRNIKEAIDARRLHHQLYPMTLQYEHGFNKTVLDLLSTKYGHSLSSFTIGGSVVCAVAVTDAGQLQANADFRKSGQIDGF